MRQETIIKNIYKFEELSEEAQENAYSSWLDGFEYFWSKENSDSLKVFCDLFNIKLKNWSYGGNNSFVDWEFNLEDEIRTLSGFRLAKYIWNNFKKDIFKGKYFSLQSKKDMNPHYKNYGVYKSRHSRIMLESMNCILTGYCTDDDILKPIYDFLDKPSNVDFEYLIQDCINSWLSAVNSDYEYQQSLEAFKDSIDTNDYEFNEDGSLY